MKLIRGGGTRLESHAQGSALPDESNQEISKNIIFDEFIDSFGGIFLPERPAAQGRNDQLEKDHAGSKVGIFNFEYALRDACPNYFLHCRDLI